MDNEQLQAVRKAIWEDVLYYGNDKATSQERKGIVMGLRWAHLDASASPEDIQDAAQGLMCSATKLAKILGKDDCVLDLPNCRCTLVKLKDEEASDGCAAD